MKTHRQFEQREHHHFKRHHHNDQHKNENNISAFKLVDTESVADQRGKKQRENRGEDAEQQAVKKPFKINAPPLNK